MNAIKLGAGLLALALLFSASPEPRAGAAGSASVLMNLNGQDVRLATESRFAGSTLMVPLRELSEALGVQVTWDADQQMASASKGSDTIKLFPGRAAAYRGDREVALEQAPFTEGNKLLVPLRFFSESFGFNVYWDALNRKVSIVDADKSLPTVGSFEKLESLLKEMPASAGIGIAVESGLMRFQSKQTVTGDTAAAAPASSATGESANASKSGTAGYSTTNVQVEGVDEADVIKTDGKYIYQVNRTRIIIADALPAESMNVVSTVYWQDPNFYPIELYVDDSHLVVIGSTTYPSGSLPVPLGEAKEQPPAAPVSGSADLMIEGDRKMALWPAPYRTATKTIVYELGDRTALKPVRETELEGHYISSRKIGDSLYIATNKSMDFHWLLRENATPAQKQAAAAGPSYRDSAAGDHFVTIGFEDIRYFPKAVEPNYLLVGGIHLQHPEQKMQVASYLGSGQHVYASDSHLYVTVSEYETAQPMPVDPGIGGIVPQPLPPAEETVSVIYKFALDGGTTRYAGRGTVPGHPLNQFSMDEHEGYFRIATTTGSPWLSGAGTSGNHIYILDEAMRVAGRLENLAPGEKIYSVRYMGSRAYLVTFKQVDPLFAVDLSDPTAPKTLGQLKIPGYSDYLHPYDENHLIGFGKEAVQAGPQDNAFAGEPAAYYQGMKLALFDVSDPANPKELFKETIGGRGTESELLHNHKALLFSKEKNLLAFPVTVMEIKDRGRADSDSVQTYGEFTFQGAYVYGVDLQTGFRLRGKVTHQTADDMKQAGSSGWYGSERNIERLLYIGDTLYSASQGMMKANDLATLKELRALPLPEWKPQP
ncbi:MULTISPECIES: beta-propeller domain-containing protein [Paenibacillus]|uniref:beta-propeller domain-containing protein n=1 Tax=Paenibacillus TaxID=44249 RepID=UPI0022B91923|nr:beta-propeller domain-containing protein [Paenibacillus caseinilyticus]MCZ8518065.1 beta-propeller domain-containing protein [Paenibacillus caseinilyticus]